MKCPTCKSANTRVLETRSFDGRKIHRRHRCQHCGSTWTSTEKMILGSMTINGVRISQKMPRAVSAGLRYKVLARDGFACGYCGARAPDVKLEVDHVMPLAKGGTNAMTNLRASCKECNGGKGASL